MFRAAVFSLVLLLFAVGSREAEAAPTQDGIAVTGTGKIRKWKTLPVRICAARDLPERFTKALRAASDVWNEAVKQKVFETSCQSVVQDFRSQSLSEHSVFWVKQGFGSTGDPLALARTLSSFDEETGEMLDADILINAENFDWTDLKVDLKSLLIHELGHVLGLQHLFISSVSVMNQYPYQSGIVRHQLGDYELRAVKKAYVSESSVTPPFFDEYFSGERDRALKLIQKQKARSADSYYAEGVLEGQRKNFAAGITAFQKSVRQDPKNPMALYRLADAYSQAGKISEAKGALKRVLELAPDFYEALADLALAEMEEGRKTEAVRLFEKTLRLNPVHYPSCFFLLKLTGDKKYQACIDRFAPKDL